MHDLAQALALADDVLLLHEGQPFYDGPADGLTGSGAIERAFGVRPVTREGVQFERIST